MLFRQLYDKETSTYTYILADNKSKEGIIIDSVIEQHQRDIQLLKELGIKLKYAIDTHIHADHITGMGLLKKATLCQIAQPQTDNVQNHDFLIQDGDTLSFGKLKITAIRSPGHTDCDTCYLINDYLFTGDCLFIRGTGRTDFQSGDAGLLYENIHRKLYSLPIDTKVYPGHDYKGMTQSTIGEEKQFNPRLTHSQEEYIQIMNALDLPKPKRIDEAVPMNLRCGI